MLNFIIHTIYNWISMHRTEHRWHLYMNDKATVKSLIPSRHSKRTAMSIHGNATRKDRRPPSRHEIDSLCGNVWIPVKPGADTERLLLRSGIGAIDCGRLLLWATPWLLRGQAARRRRAVSCRSWTTGSWRKKKARIALSCQASRRGYAIEIYGNITVVD